MQRREKAWELLRGGGDQSSRMLPKHVEFDHERSKNSKAVHEHWHVTHEKRDEQRRIVSKTGY